MKFIRKFIGKLLLKIGGWKMVGDVPKDDKYVCIIAPHTSFRDIFVGKLYNWANNMKPVIMVKKEFFFFPISCIIKRWGAIPVDRKKTKNIVEQMADYFRQKDKMLLAITPEGTRSLVKEWKTGFYRIAEAAKVPIYLSFIDFKTKTVGFLERATVTGNMKSDIDMIKQKYQGMVGFIPSKFSV